MALPLIQLPAYSHGGPFTAGAPVGVAVHSTESENTPAMAEALAGPNWFGGSKAGTSAHKVVDVDSICEGVKRTTIAYHAGPGGNVVAIAYEFCGRASWSAATWREPAQLQMLRNAAPHIADDLRAIGAPARWLSLAQLATAARTKRAADGGLFTHNDIRLALGGTTHSDPGPNFPYAELLAYVLAELNGTPTTQEDELETTEKQQLFNADQNSYQARILAGSARDEAQAANQRLAELKGLLVAQTAEGSDLTEEQIRAAAEQGARDGAKALLSAAVQDLTEAVDAALRADNADAADKAVAIIRDRLATSTVTAS